MEGIHEEIEICDGCPNQLPDAGCVSVCPPDRQPDSIDYFRGEYAFLSNFFEFPFEYQGLTWKTSEHAFQSMKAEDPYDMTAIAEAPTPAMAKKMGRKFKMVDNWNDIKDSIMEEVLRAKFSVPGLKALLLATGDVYLREGNTWRDQYWGQTCEFGNWKGENRLGKLLMKIRQEIKDGIGS